MLLTVKKAILTEVYQGKNAKYLTFTTPNGPLKLTDKAGVFNSVEQMLPYQINAELRGSLFQGRLNLEVVNAQFKPA